MEQPGQLLYNGRVYPMQSKGRSMPGTAISVVEVLQRFQLLEPEQLAELPALRGQFPDPGALVQELIRQGWLTSYQCEFLQKGKAAELVLGSYVLLDRLGEGGMGAVFKARHQTLGRIVALKLIRKERLDNPAAVRRFRREIKAAAQLNHPNVVLAFDADEVNGIHFFTMEFVEGTDLNGLVQEKGPLRVDQACDYVRQAALGLQAAHERGLVHRDIKPANLLLTTKGVVKVMDLGLARGGQAGDESGSTLTHDHGIMGTPDYLAPEQALAAHTVDIRADLYSLGCTLYFLLSGQVPFPGGSMTEKLLKHQMEEPEPIEKLRPDVPAAVVGVMRRLTAKKPDDRYATPAEAAAALAKVGSAGTAGPAPPPPRRAMAAPAPESSSTVQKALVKRRGLREQARRRLLLLSGAGVVGLLAAGLLLASLLGRSVGTSPVPAVPSTPSTIDRASIPEYELRVAGGGDPGQAPAGLVAILGDSRLRHWNNYRSLHFTADGRTLISLGGDQVVKVWDLPDGRERFTWEANGLAVSADGSVLALAAAKGSVRLVQTATGRILHTLNTEPVTYLAFSPDGNTLATSGRGRSRQWDVGTGKERPSPVSSELVAWSPDGRWLAVPAGPNMLGVCAAETGREQHQLPVKQGDPFVFSPDGQRLAAKDETRIRVFDLTSGQVLQQFEAHAYYVSHLAFSPDGRWLASSGHEHRVKIWDLGTGRTLHQLQAASLDSVFAFGPDGRTLAVGANGSHIQMWDLTSGKENPSDVQPRYTAAAFRPDGKSLLLGTANGLVQVWDLDPKNPPRQFADGLQSVRIGAVAVSPDGRCAAAGSNTAIKVWEVDGARERRKFQEKGGDSLDFAFFPQRPALAVVNMNATNGWLRLFDLPDGPARPLPADGQRTSLAISPDGKDVATGTKDGKVVVCSVADGQERVTWSTSSVRPTESLTYSPDGRWLMTTHPYDSTIHILDTAAGKEVKLLPEKGYPGCVAFHPDGKSVATAAMGGAVRLWDMPGWQEQDQLRIGPPLGRIHQIAFSPDGRSLVTVNGNGTVYLLRR